MIFVVTAVASFALAVVFVNLAQTWKAHPERRREVTNSAAYTVMGAAAVAMLIVQGIRLERAIECNNESNRINEIRDQGYNSIIEPNPLEWNRRAEQVRRENPLPTC